MKKLYVGNLAYSTTSDDLVKLFSEYGAVSSANVIMDKYSGASKGFAFIEMDNKDAAEKAILGLNGTSVGGRNLKVNEAMAKEKNSRVNGSDSSAYRR